jgi:molecular chaperone GrpE
MTIYFTKSALKKDPAFVICEAERPGAEVSGNSAVLDLLHRSLEEMERVGKSLYRLSLTQESISRELATLTRRAPQSDFFEMRRRLAEDYFPVMDALHRLARVLAAVESHSAELAAPLAPLVEGARIIEQKGIAYLEAMGVQAIPAAGEVFDPQLHQAVETRDVSQEMEGRVVEEIVRGYRMGEKVLRAAQVVVGKDSKLTTKTPRLKDTQDNISS